MAETHDEFAPEYDDANDAFINAWRESMLDSWPRLKFGEEANNAPAVSVNDVTAYVHDELAPEDERLLTPKRRAKIQELIETYPQWLMAYMRYRSEVTKAANEALSGVHRTPLHVEDQVRALIRDALEKHKSEGTLE